MKRVLLIIPTYNEQANIAPLYAGICNYCPETDILFVDDNSQDGTAEQIKALQLQARPGSIHLLSRPAKLGLGTAYVAGFRWGLEKGYDLLIEMDADLSHDPAYLPIFVAELDHCDVLVGSRYMAGGGTQNWNLYRRLISKTGSRYASCLLGMQLGDFTGGYNGWHRHVLAAINLDSLTSDGYVFQIELKYRALLLGFRLKESPIIFMERRAGQSKMTPGIVWEAIYKVICLRLRKKKLLAGGKISQGS